MHCDQALAAIAAGKHVLCEKPLARTVAECDKIVAAAEASPCVFQVGLEMRYAKYTRRLKEILDSGEIGRVQLLWLKEFRSPFYPGFGGWRLNQEKSGGALVEKLCHHTDLFDWFIDSRPARVCAFGGTDMIYKDDPKADIVDNAWMMIEYENTVRATLGMVLCLDKFDKVEFGAVGTEGMLEGVVSETLYDADAAQGTCNVVKSYHANEIIVTRTKDFRRSVIEVPPVTANQTHTGTLNQWIEFAHCIREGATPFVDVHVGRSSILAPAAAELSIQKGAVINISEL
jgi:predicted dehydrogenase